MMAQQLRTEVIANNLANVNTTAFKGSRAHFQDLLYQSVQNPSIIGSPDSNTMPAIQVGRGTKLAAVQRLHSQGPVEETSRPLDVAIEGEGFFQVQLPNGQTAYTRDGSFGISDTGTLVTSEGYTVVPGIKLPSDASNLSISPTGVVSVQQGSDTSQLQELGRIEIARFMNPTGLQAIGENLYTETPASGQATVGFPSDEGMGRLLQGHLEGSNVEIVQEMVDMISAMRAYEINSKSIKNAEEMMTVANNMIR
jgi:flagellar basal-body rod protein FlgG